MVVDIGFLEWVGLRNAAGAKINPATQETLGELDASFGDTTDAGTAAGGAGTAQGKLRKLTSQLNDLANLIGQVQANPTSNTLQDRLKRAVTALEVDIAKERTSGSAMPAKVTPIGGTDGTDLQAMRVDADGHPQVDVLSGGGTEPVIQTVVLIPGEQISDPIEVDGNSSLCVQPRNPTGNRNFSVEESNNGTDWKLLPIAAPPSDSNPTTPQLQVQASGQAAIWIAPVSSKFIRFRANNLIAGDTMTVDFVLTPAPSRQVWVHSSASARVDALSEKFAAKDAAARQPVTTHPGIGVDVAAGIVYTAGNELSLAAGQAGAFAIENPAGSGKTLVILGFTLRQDTTTSLNVQFYENPTVTGGVVLTPINHLRGGPASGMVVTSGQGILSGGTVLDADARVVRDEGIRYDGPPFIVPPGTTLALQTTAPSGLTGGAVISGNVVYKET